jgi:hypothetical protein
VIPLVIRLFAADRYGRPCCPDLDAAVRLVSVEVEVYADVPGDDVLRAAERLRRDARLVLRSGGRAAMAALMEIAAGAGQVTCHADRMPLDVESLAARLRAGTVWS